MLRATNDERQLRPHLRSRRRQNRGLWQRLFGTAIAEVDAAFEPGFVVVSPSPFSRSSVRAAAASGFGSTEAGAGAGAGVPWRLTPVLLNERGP